MAAQYRRQRPVEPVVIALGIGLTVLLHGGVITAAAVFSMGSEAHFEETAQPELAHFEPVELLALGEEKKPNALPRIANPEPETVEEDTVNLAKPDPDKVVLEKPKPKTEEDKKKQRVDRSKKKADLLKGFHNPNRPTNDDTPEGFKEGVSGGTATDPALKHLMGSYQAKLINAIQRQWSVPSTIQGDRAQELAGKVKVYCRISKDGHVVSYQMRAKSGDPAFDASVERAVKMFMPRYGGRKLPVHDNPEIMDLVVKKGLSLRRWKPRG